MGLNLWAYNDDTKLTKTITKAYKVPLNVQLELRNKYGAITVNTWKKDSVKAKIEITAFGKNEATVSKELDRVEIEFVNNRDYLLMETILDRKSGFFTELWNNIGDYSKNLLSKNQLEINYTVFIPESADLVIINRYGDVFTYGIKGDLEVTLAHGSLRSDVIEQGKLDLSFSSARIREFKRGSFISKAVDAEIYVAGRLDMTTSSSEITVDDAEFLKLDSQSDKKITIKKADIVRGTTRFSNISMRTITNALDLDMNYGELKMAPVMPGFNSITIHSKSTDIRIAFDESIYLDTNIEAKEEYLILPEDANLDITYLDDKEKHLSIRGQMGNPSGKRSRLTVTSDNGELWIKFVDPKI
jgi:hypothetical protein